MERSEGASVIVSTYNDPARLMFVLEGLSRQVVRPLDVHVADDGSRDETRELCEAWKERLPFPLHHHWHPDRGKRKGTIANHAVVESVGTELLFLDGDSIPHSRWISDHLECAGRGQVRCGRRVKLGPRITERVMSGDIQPKELESPFGPTFRSAVAGDTLRFGLSVRLPRPLVKILHPKPRRLMGVNFSVSRTAFEAVNGYDMNWSGRREDRELEIRLQMVGATFVPLINRAVVYHLFHPEGTPTAATQARLSELKSRGQAFASNGLDQLIPQT